MKKTNDFESTLTELDAIVNRLESGELPLEEALTEFEKGMKLVQQGQQRLQKAEQKVKILLDKHAEAELADYQDE